jgi:hypothetical protein
MGVRRKEKIKKWWVPRLEGEWRASRNGGWEWEFGVGKMEVHIEVLLELVFFPKTSKFWSRGP